MSEEIVLVSIPKNELQTLIIDSVNACLDFHLPKIEKEEQLPELLTRQQVAKYLSVSLKTVDNIVKDGHLKKYSFSGSTRFKREDVRAVPESWQPYQRSK